MKARSSTSTPRRRVGRPRKSQTDAKKSKIIVLDSSSCEETTNTISLSDQSINSTAKTSKMLASMKKVCIKVLDLANVPGALTPKHMAYLSARHLKSKEQAARLERRRAQKRESRRKAKVKRVTKAITISSDSTEFVQIVNQTVLPKSLVKDSSEFKEKPKNVEEKSGRSVSPISFGQAGSLETPPRRINEKNDVYKKTISVCSSSVSSTGRVSTTTKTQKRQYSKLDVNSFVADLDESSRKQRQRNSRKRQRVSSDASIERRRKRGLGKDSVKGESGLSERSIVDQVDSPQASRNDFAQGDKLTAAVDDSAGKASIAPVNDIVAPVSEIVAPVNEIIAPVNQIVAPVNDIIARNDSIAPVNESIVSRKESIAADHRVVDNASVDEPDKASVINVENKTSAVNNAGKAFDFSPVVNGDFRNEDFSSFQPFFGCPTDIKMVRLETTENEQLTLFSAPDNDADHALDKDPCSLDSIVEAIDNDMAGGYQPIGLPIGGIDNAEIMSLLPDTAILSDEGNRPENVERLPDASSKIQESFDTPPTNGELAPILGNGNGSINGNGNGNGIFNGNGNVNRKRPSIIGDQTFAKGSSTAMTLQMIRDNRKRKKVNRSASGTPASSVDDNRNFADSIEINLSRDEKLLDPVNDWEIEALLNDKCVNNDSRAPAKVGQICEDALNNNRGTTVTNKNEVNSEKQEIVVNEKSAKPVTPQTDGDEEYNALKSVVEMGSDALDKVIAEGGAASDHESFDDDKITEALDRFTAEVAMNSSKSSTPRETVNGEAKSVGPLTVQNLDKFNSRTGLVETVNNSASLKRRETIDTDGSSRESARLRKRKWVTANGEKSASSPAKSGTIKLNRKNWSTGSQDSRDKSREVEQPIDLSAEPEEPAAKIAKNEDKQNDEKTPDLAKAVAVINGIAGTLISPIKNVQLCGNEVGALLPSFGSSSLHDLATSTPTKKDVAPDVGIASDDTSGSSSSSSSSDSSSSSSSSSEDSSDDSDDEDISSNVEIAKDGEAVATKNSEAPCQSDSGSKKSALTTRQTVEEKTLALFGAEPEPVATEKPGSLIDGCDDAEKSDGDESDCISLYTESLCMSRCASPEREVSAKRSTTPQKQQKRGNVRSRLGPRVVQNQPNAATAPTNNSELTERSPPTVTSSNLGCDSAANNRAAVEPTPNNAPCRPVASNVIQVYPEATAPVYPDPTAIYRRQIEQLFRGHCWSWLKFKRCRNLSMCRFLHEVPQLKYQLVGMMNTRAIIQHAISKEYRHFIESIYKDLIPLMSVRQLVQFGIDVRGSKTLKHEDFVEIIDALKVHNLTLVEVVSLFDSMLSTTDVKPAMVIIESFYNMADLGTYWQTLKKLLTKFADAQLPTHVLTEVLKECVDIHTNKPHVDDVHDNLVAKLTNAMRLALGGDLLKTFYDLRYAHVVAETENAPVEVVKKSNWTCSIASPDSSKESVDFPLAALLADRPSTSSSASAVQPQAEREISKPPTASQSDEASTSGSESYSLKQLDKLAPPKSAYNLWKFHLDLQGVQQGLLHKDYDHVINILKELQRDPNRLPHIAGFYNILCKEIMSSRHHLEEIVRRTVQSGATDELRRFVYDLGLYVLTTLADTGAWVLAYQLLKTFKVYGQYNTCAFTLLSAEIYIANHRPLKALAILKQTQLVFTNTRCWNQMWCPNDEPLRVSVMELLLSSLCDGYAEHALSLLEFILGDQCSSFKPINISRYIDRVAAVLLKEDLTNAVVDLGRLIVQNNLLVSSRIFRALINRIIHSDQFLAKQLHRYATWLGIYNMPKISGVTHMIVNIDWTEEEMYLMFSSLLYDLYINIGHAIGRLRPRQLAVYLILERLPTERQLLKNESGPPLTNAEIRKRRAVVKSVFERFDPKIKVIQRLQGKLCKVQSESLVNYLKAGHFKC